MNQPCTVLISSDGKLSSIDIATLRADLESKDIQKKRNAVKSAIIQMSNGKDMSDLLMTVIRFCVTVDDHELTKLLHIYWECAQKCDENGDLKPEMILVCNAIMNNLKHANEYIRGCTLRFLSKIPEEEILEPLIPYIKENLEHHSPYVRKNAVLTWYG
ncbi:beta subunit of the coatomer [Blastocystis sp. subtype 4]|uniref:beta subunit of the coatomer n=1 Tax=Blastocystis sp. subtype 4 TaxID=944170 RepID=UPI000711B71A|nr:beta subunit of the coatomer [Blastocystis sp. subtype 4]KNB43973.1 beta subunit of the coatomer [Blastocystis sp. subtype 4]|eukprot:XP_014527416.1 beta subunit of the coatomer [Blastocystis sp. subtype 4]